MLGRSKVDLHIHTCFSRFCICGIYDYKSLPWFNASLQVSFHHCLIIWRVWSLARGLNIVFCLIDKNQVQCCIPRRSCSPWLLGQQYLAAVLSSPLRRVLFCIYELADSRRIALLTSLLSNCQHGWPNGRPNLRRLSGDPTPSQLENRPHLHQFYLYRYRKQVWRCLSFQVCFHVSFFLSFIRFGAWADTSMERNTLMATVYPKLKEYCREKHGLEFQVNLIEPHKVIEQIRFRPLPSIPLHT